MINRLSRTQHPVEVAQAIVRQCRRDAWTPETRLIVQKMLRPYAPKGLTMSGKWIPPALHQWSIEHLTFVREPHVEIIQSLARLAPPPFSDGSGVGDCDDMTLAVCTALESCGIPAYVGLAKMGPLDFHVFPVAAADWGGVPEPSWVLDAQWPKPVQIDWRGREGVYLFSCNDEGDALPGRTINQSELAPVIAPGALS